MAETILTMPMTGLAGNKLLINLAALLAKLLNVSKQKE